MSGITVLQARAFRIADESMLALLAAHCATEDTPKGILLVPLNVRGERVSRLDEAEPAIVEAFDYLRERGLANQVRSTRGTLAIKVHEIRQHIVEG